MKKQPHALEEIRDQIKTNGLMIFDNINRVPIYEKAYASNKRNSINTILS